MNPDLLAEVRRLVGLQLGLDYSRERGELLDRKLTGALQGGGCNSLELAAARLADLAPESPELMRFARHLTVGETYFFRDLALFEALRQQVLPALIAARRAAGALYLRLWSAGCSTGEEAYSLAILLDRLLPDAQKWRLAILATDIDPVALAWAREGRYGEWSFRGTPAWVREHYFSRPDAKTYEVIPRIREGVIFKPLNLAQESYPSGRSGTTELDLVLCRNVLMYFTAAARRSTVERLQGALIEGGLLAVGPPEASAPLLSPLVPVNFPGTTLFRKDRAAPESPHFETPGLPPPMASACAAVESPPPVSTAAPAPEPRTCSHSDARALADRGDLRGARAVSARLARLNPLDIDAQLLLAVICEADGDDTAAREALRRVLYLAPECAMAQFSLGTLLLRQGEHARGRRFLSEVAHRLEILDGAEPLEHGDGITAGDLLARAHRWLESGSDSAGRAK